MEQRASHSVSFSRWMLFRLGRRQTPKESDQNHAFPREWLLRVIWITSEEEIPPLFAWIICTKKWVYYASSYHRNVLTHKSCKNGCFHLASSTKMMGALSFFIKNDDLMHANILLSKLLILRQYLHFCDEFIVLKLKTPFAIVKTA